MVRPSRNTPMAPQTISTGRLPSTRPMPPGSGRQPGFWRRGSGHRTASATNETTSTIAAAVLGHVTLDLELALEGRLELEARGLSGRDLLLDVVAVQVNVVRRVGAD